MSLTVCITTVFSYFWGLITGLGIDRYEFQRGKVLIRMSSVTGRGIDLSFFIGARYWFPSKIPDNDMSDIVCRLGFLRSLSHRCTVQARLLTLTLHWSIIYYTGFLRFLPFHSVKYTYIVQEWVLTFSFSHGYSVQACVLTLTLHSLIYYTYTGLSLSCFIGK